MSRPLILTLVLSSIALMGFALMARAIARSPVPPKQRRLEPCISVLADLREVPPRLRSPVVAIVGETVAERLRALCGRFAVEPASPGLFVIMLAERPDRVAAIAADLGSTDDFPVPVRVERWEGEP